MVIVAVSGCVHGEINLLYENLYRLEQSYGVKADILLCTGDFQAIRDYYDLEALSCPAKYKKLGDFKEYYTKARTAPLLTIIIGGNHESVLYMHSAINGGWIAPNMYYMGRCGVVRYGNLKIAGLSGIYNAKCYNKPLPKLPRTEKDYKSLYYVRNADVNKLSNISSPDIFMSHDWPQYIYNYGDTPALLNKKRFFRDCVQDNSLGSPPNFSLLTALRPKYWFASHMHVKFAAEYGSTSFLALDKAIRPKEFIEILNIPGEAGLLTPDEEWLRLNRLTPSCQFEQYYPD